jgi:D-lactate dehydrogenase (cytochrome)
MASPHETPAQAPALRELLARLTLVAGVEGVLLEPEDMAPYALDQREVYAGVPLAVVRPRGTEQVAQVVKLCAAAGVSVVPQGGNTGLCGGSVPDSSGRQVVLSLTRMNRIRELVPRDFSITVEAGCVLADVQAAAEEAGLLFPLSLAAEGSCQIGGNLATNAGGTAVLRYGNARDLVLGLEVVLADGRIWNGLRRLRKDNTGYKLHQLFVGSEGTLGIITAAVLKLFPRPRDVHTALIAVPDPDAALGLLERLREASGDAVTTFEYINRPSFALALEWVDGNRDPFDCAHEHYVLAELSAGSAGGGLRGALEEALGAAFESGQVVDAVMADSAAQAQALWRLRESIPEAQKRASASIKHDISVPVSRVPELLARGSELMREEVPDVVVVAFGHMGDGNIHFNANQRPGVEAGPFLEARDCIHRRMYALVSELDGSFSAEHGIGQLKREQMQLYRPEEELDLMRRIKAALDPHGVLNPGKVV